MRKGGRQFPALVHYLSEISVVVASYDWRTYDTEKTCATSLSASTPGTDEQQPSYQYSDMRTVQKRLREVSTRSGVIETSYLR